MNVCFIFEIVYREKDLMIMECFVGYFGIDGSIFGGFILVIKFVYNV